MADKIVHFEVVGKDGPEADGLLRPAVRLDRERGQPDELRDGRRRGVGYRRGISAAQEGSDGHLTFYVGVDDLQAALDKAESLGGKTVTPPMEILNLGTFAMFTDPEGHLVGLVKN